MAKDKDKKVLRTKLFGGFRKKDVLAYLKENRMISALDIQHQILNAYVADMAKYISANETAKVMACFDSIPAQLAKDNHKFQYKIVQRGGKTSLFGASLDWLAAAGIISVCNLIEHGYNPPEAFKDLSSFKVYMNDVGLLAQKAKLEPHDLLSKNGSMFIGAITENYVANALTANGYTLYYWASKGTAEIDFVLQRSDGIIPVEVKAREHVRSRSLSVFIAKYKPPYAIRISARNFGFENEIMSVPLYAVFCL